MKNADMPAMPIIDTGESYPLNIERYGDGLITGKFASGLTKREMMAMHMMAACQAKADSFYKTFDDMANDAVNMADALLAELERTCQKT